MSAETFDGLLEELKPEKRWKTVDEDWFLRAGLPTAMLRLTGKPCDTGHWAAMAGNEFNGVHVTRDGEYLFTAPPISNRVAVSIEADFVAIVQRTIRDRANNINSDAMLREVFSRESTKITVASFKEQMIAWIMIFSYYGFKMTIVDDGVVVKGKEDEPEEGIEEWC